MNGAICGDNRFEIIEKAKQAILEETNIKDDKVQMAELDGFLFRCWQMGWLKKYEEKETNEGQALLYAVEKTAERTKREMIEKATQFIYDTIFGWTGGSVTKTWNQCRDEYVGRLKQAMQDDTSQRL